MKKLTVLHVKVGQEPVVKTVDNTIEALQGLVEGYIETVRIADDLLLVVNEEGLLQHKPMNFMTFALRAEGLVPVHEIVGDVFFVSWLGEDFTSLDKLQIQRIKDMFKADGKALVVKPY